MADYLRIAGLNAACHTFQEVPMPTLIASTERVTLQRARALGMVPIAEVGKEWQGEVRVSIGRNGLFWDLAGGVWMLTAEGLKQVMGFEPAEETERLATLSRNKKLESRSPYEVTKSFTASKLQSEEGYATEQDEMTQGQILFADPEYWKGKLWEGEEIVQFCCGLTRFYVGRSTFLNLTRRTTFANRERS